MGALPPGGEQEAADGCSPLTPLSLPLSASPVLSLQKSMKRLGERKGEKGFISLPPGSPLGQAEVAGLRPFDTLASSGDSRRRTGGSGGFSAGPPKQ